MPQCARCQEPVAADAERCPKCGAWLSQTAEASEPNRDSFEDSIRMLMNSGRKIGAIKLYREQTGVGLAEAKAAVEAMAGGEQLAEIPAATNDLDKQILELMAAGQKIAAIKLCRERMRSRLKEA